MGWFQTSSWINDQHIFRGVETTKNKQNKHIWKKKTCWAFLRGLVGTRFEILGIYRFSEKHHETLNFWGGNAERVFKLQKPRLWATVTTQTRRGRKRLTIWKGWGHSGWFSTIERQTWVNGWDWLVAAILFVPMCVVSLSMDKAHVPIENQFV